MQRRVAEIAGIAAAAGTLVLAFAGAGLWDPTETALVEKLSAGDVTVTRPLDAAITSAGLYGATPFAARLGHAVFGIAAIVAIWLVAPRRARWFAASALVASPAFLLGARSAAGGVVVVLPLALSAWGFIDHLRGGRASSLGVGVVGAWLASLAAGIAACAVPLVAVLALCATTPALRRHAATSVIAIAVAGVLGAVLCRTLGAPLVPGELPKTLAFDHGLGRAGLGLFPLVLALPVALSAGALDDTRRAWLAFAAAWIVPVMLWPQDPWIALAPAGALAVVAGDAYAALVDDEPMPALAIVLALGALVIARSFQLDPAALVGAHVDGAVEIDGKLGVLALLACAVHAGALAWAAIGSRRTLALGLALAAALLVTLRGARLGTHAPGAGDLVALARTHRLPLDAGLGTTDHAVAFAGATIRELDAGALAAHLTAPGCRAAIVADDKLVELHRHARGKFFVIGAPRAGLVLATSCLPPGTRDDNPLAKTLLDHVPALGRPVDGAWGEAVELRAVDAPVQVTTKAAEVPVTLVFAVTRPLPPRYGVLLRMTGCDARFSGDAFLADRRLATDALRPGDVIVHEAKIALEDAKPCAYTLSVGWNARRQLLPVTRGASDESERIAIGTVTVVPAP